MFYKVAFFIAFVGVGGYLLYSLFKGKFKKKSSLSKVGLGFLSLILISTGFNITRYNNQTNIADKTKIEKIEKEIEDQNNIKEKEKIKERRKIEEAKEKLESESNKVVQHTNNSSGSKSTSNSQCSNNMPVQQKVEEVQPEPLTNSQNVYITKNGSKYHRNKCGRGNFFEIKLQEAQNRGLEPCSKCY